HVIHRKQDAAMYRFKAITGVRQCASNNHAHGVIKIAAAHFLVNADGANCSYIDHWMLRRVARKIDLLQRERKPLHSFLSFAFGTGAIRLNYHYLTDFPHPQLGASIAYLHTI